MVIGLLSPAYVGFVQSGTGAIDRTAEDKLRERLSVADFGATGDGTTDDTLSIQNAIDQLVAEGGGELWFPPGSYIVGDTLDGTALSNATLIGRGTLLAKSGSDYVHILDCSGAANVQIEGLTFDANKDARGSATNRLSCLLLATSTDCRVFHCTFQNTLGTVGPVSSVALSATNGCVGLLVDGCTFLNLGTDANTKPSDGVFLRGNYCTISNCYAEHVTDTAFVMEGCNYSRVIGCTANSCTSIAGISNDTVDDLYGNQILGISGTSNYAGSGGGIVAVFTSGTGKIRDCTIGDVAIRLETGATGGGPAFYFAGNVDGLNVRNVIADCGPTSGIMNHGIVASGVLSVDIIDSYVKMDTIGTCVRVLGQATGVRVRANRLENGSAGIAIDSASGTSSVTENDNTFPGCATRVLLGTGGVGLMEGAATWDPPSIASGSQASTTLTVSGASLGDYVQSISFSLDLQGLILTGYVSTSNTVTAVLTNLTGAAVNLSSGTIRVVCDPPGL